MGTATASAAVFGTLAKNAASAQNDTRVVILTNISGQPTRASAEAPGAGALPIPTSAFGFHL